MGHFQDKLDDLSSWSPYPYDPEDSLADECPHPLDGQGATIRCQPYPHPMSDSSLDGDFGFWVQKKAITAKNLLRATAKQKQLK